MNEHVIQAFILNNCAIQAQVERSRTQLVVNRQNVYDSIVKDDHISSYLPQFDQKLREQSIEMAVYYEMFFLLENDIRKMIVTTLSDSAGADWWKKCVPPSVQKTAEDNKRKELENAVSLRSTREIDYVNFGELGEIIKTNMDTFGAVIRSVRTLEKILSTLNLIRGAIAHCGLLAEDEILRLKIAIKDWYRFVQ